MSKSLINTSKATMGWLHSSIKKVTSLVMKKVEYIFRQPEYEMVFKSTLDLQIICCKDQPPPPLRTFHWPSPLFHHNLLQIQVKY